MEDQANDPAHESARRDVPVEAGDQSFGIEVDSRSGTTVVAVSGELDLLTAPRLRQVLFDPLLCSQPRVVVDLREVSFLDSTGIGTLVAGRRWATSREVDFALLCVDGPALRTIELVSLDKVFRVHRTLAEALGGPAEPTEELPRTIA